MTFFKTKYRVVSDSWNGYEAQFKVWWFPFWMMVGFSNTKATLEEAQDLCRQRHKRTFGVVVWSSDEDRQVQDE